MRKTVDFIRSIYKSEEFIPLYAPTFRGNEKKFLNECIDSNNVSTVSPFVNKFEESVLKYTGAKYAVATVNGTSALHLALVISGVKTGHEVITQPLTYVATANAIAYTGAEPVFIDIDKTSLGLSPKKLAFFLENETTLENGKRINKKTKAQISAIMPMHTFGVPAEIDKLIAIGNTYGIPIIEDAAEGLGSFYKNRHIGTFGKMGVLSFNGNKTITTGGGGMILTNDKKIAKKALHLSNTAKIEHAYLSIHNNIGYNYRMPGLNAALGLAQMEQLENTLFLKRKLAKTYHAFFKGSDIKCIDWQQNRILNNWMNVVKCVNQKQRDEFVDVLNKNKINARPAWTLMNHLEMFKECQFGNLDNALIAEKTIALLPSGVHNELNF